MNKIMCAIVHLSLPRCHVSRRLYEPPRASTRNTKVARKMPVDARYNMDKKKLLILM